MRALCFIVFFLSLVSAEAGAGVLFPPANSVKNAAGVPTCPTRSSLVWSTAQGGSLNCVDTTSMVQVPSCPVGEAMVGITNGKAQCRKAGGGTTVRTVSASAGAYRWPHASVQCGGDEVVTGGGGHCSSGPGDMRMPLNAPSGNGWIIGCDTGTKTAATATVWAICAKR